MKKIDKRLFRMIRDTKGQFVCVTVILAVGLLFYIAMGLSAWNLRHSMDTYYDLCRFADLSVSVRGVSRQQVRALTEIDGVETAEGRITRIVPLLTGDPADDRAKVKLISLAPDQQINRLYLIEGRMPEPEEQKIAVIEQFARARDLHPGDTVQVQISGRSETLEISAVVSSPEFIYLVENSQSFLPNDRNYGVLFLSEEAAGPLLGRHGSYNEIQISVRQGLSESRLAAAVDAAERILEPYRSQGIVRQENQLSNALLQAEVDQLRRMAGSLPMLFLAIAALILAMMIGRMVKRDRQAIGILKALGYSAFQVSLHYVKYALLAAVAGGLVGTTGGILSAGALSQLYATFFRIPVLNQDWNLQYAPVSLTLAFLFCILAGLWGARGVLKITPAESMQAEAPKRGRRILLERIGFLWSRLSFSNKMAVRNVFRNRRRSLFILAGVTVTFAMMVFVACMPAMMSNMMGEGLREFQPMDYNVSLHEPVRLQTLNELRHEIEDITALEGRTEYGFRLTNGTGEITLPVIGIEKDTVFYNFRDQVGNPVRAPEDGILLSDYAASELKVRPGDQIKVHSWLPNTKDRLLTVEGVIYQGMGANGYMAMEALADLCGAGDFATGFYLNTADPEAEKKLLELPAVASVVSMATIRQIFQEYTGMVNVSIAFMLILSGILGFAIVYTATLIGLGERETEFSSLRVLGFSRFDIFRMILKENHLITAAGLLAGVPLTRLFLTWSSDIFSTEQYTMNMQASPQTWAVGVAATIFFIVLGQLAAWQKIRTLDFMAALKNRA